MALLTSLTTALATDVKFTTSTSSGSVSTASAIALLLSINLTRIGDADLFAGDSTSVVTGGRRLVRKADSDVTSYEVSGGVDSGRDSFSNTSTISTDTVDDHRVPTTTARRGGGQDQRFPLSGSRVHAAGNFDPGRSLKSTASTDVVSETVTEQPDIVTSSTSTQNPTGKRPKGTSRAASSVSLLSWERRKSNMRKSSRQRQRQQNVNYDEDTKKRLQADRMNDTAAFSWTTSSRYAAGGSRGKRPYDPTADDSLGASYYVTAVLVVYSLSVVALLASRISRKHTRLLEDRQTRKYLQEFQIVKERSTRDTYRSMKRAIVAKLSRGGTSSSTTTGPSTISGGQLHAHRNIGRAMLPLVAVVLPALPEEDDWTPDSNTGLLLSATSAASPAVVVDANCGSRRPSYSLGTGSSNIGSLCVHAPILNNQHVEQSHVTSVKRHHGGAESSFSESDGRNRTVDGSNGGRGSFGLASTADADVDDDDDVDDDIASSSDIYRTTNDDYLSFELTSPTFELGDDFDVEDYDESVRRNCGQDDRIVDDRSRSTSEAPNTYPLRPVSEEPSMVSQRVGSSTGQLQAHISHLIDIDGSVPSASRIDVCDEFNAITSNNAERHNPENGAAKRPVLQRQACSYPPMSGKP